MIKKFTPYIKTYKKFNGVYPSNEIEREPQFYQSTVEYVNSIKEAKITNEILFQMVDIIRRDDIIDTRVAMLMPGYFPSIPGWHCDNFDRHRNGQPDLLKENDSEHYMTLIADTDQLLGTEFITQEHEFNLDELNVWETLHDQVQRNSWLPKRNIEIGEIVYFNQEAIHRAVSCNKRGWRMFFRLTRCKRIVPINKIRTQSQVYLISENGGW